VVSRHSQWHFRAKAFCACFVAITLLFALLPLLLTGAASF
jgi:hypothetical protein